MTDGLSGHDARRCRSRARLLSDHAPNRERLRRVRHAMCREETRYYLNGVYMHHVARENVLRFVGTTGIALHRWTFQRPMPARPQARAATPSGTSGLCAKLKTAQARHRFSLARRAIGSPN
jgi:hypothetical protein